MRRQYGEGWMEAVVVISLISHRCMYSVVLWKSFFSLRCPQIEPLSPDLTRSFTLKKNIALLLLPLSSSDLSSHPESYEFETCNLRSPVELGVKMAICHINVGATANLHTWIIPAHTYTHSRSLTRTHVHTDTHPHSTHTHTYSHTYSQTEAVSVRRGTTAYQSSMYAVLSESTEDDTKWRLSSAVLRFILFLLREKEKKKQIVNGRKRIRNNK